MHNWLRSLYSRAHCTDYSRVGLLTMSVWTERFFNNKMGHKVHTGIYWTNLELKGLLEDEDSCVSYERHKKHIGMHPAQLRNVTTALNEILNSTVNSYDTELKGLLLAYKNPALLSPLAGILHDSCYIHIDIEADFYIFKPEVGVRLKGFVNKRGLNHIGVLVHKVFIVSIPQPDEEEDWPGNKVNIGQEIRFTVNEVDFRSRLPYIRGILHEDEYVQGCKLFNTEMAEADEAIGSHDRKRKITFNEDFISDPSVVSARKRKRITFDTDSEEEEENGVKPMICLSQESSQPELEGDLEAEDQKPRKKKSHKKARISNENEHILSPSSEGKEVVFKSPIKKSRNKSHVTVDVKLNFDSEEEQKPTHLVQRFVEEYENLDEGRKFPLKKSKKMRKSSESRDEASGAESEGSRESKHQKKKAKFSQQSLEEPSSDLEDRKPINLLANHKSKVKEVSESRDESSSAESGGTREKKNKKKKAKLSLEKVEEPNLDLEDRKPIHLLAKHKSKSSEKSEKMIEMSENNSDVSSLESSQDKKKKSKKESNPENGIDDYENILENGSQQVNGNEGHKKRKSKSGKKSDESQFSFDVLTKIKSEPIDVKVKKEPSDTLKSKAKKIVDSG